MANMIIIMSHCICPLPTVVDIGPCLAIHEMFLKLSTALPASMHSSRLASLSGEDWALYEWAIATAMQAASPPLVPLTARRVATATLATPTMLSFAPPMPYYMQGSADTLLLAADSTGALRLLHADSATCVGVYATPSFAVPLTDSFALRSDSDLHLLSVRRNCMSVVCVICIMFS